MAAYSAVVSLEQLLYQLFNSDLLPKEEVVSLHGNISSLKLSLEVIFPAPKKDRDEAHRLAIRIREKIFEAQDTIESFIFFTQNHPPESPEASKSQSLTSISLEKIIADIDPIVEDAKKLADSIEADQKYTQPADESQIYESSASGQKSKTVGQEEYKAEIEKKLLATTGSRLVIPICGMPGIGKTALAESIYEDDNFMQNFPYKAWVTISKDANTKDILRKLLHSLESRGQKAGDMKYEGDEAKLRLELRKALSNNKYLVVIDDLCDPKIWWRIKSSLPDNENSSRVLITAWSLEVADAVKLSSMGVGTKIVGQEKYKELVIKKLKSYSGRLEVIPITGMPGIGKTTLARSIYSDATINSIFSHRAWVTLSHDYSLVDIMAKLLNSMEISRQKAGDKVYQGDERKLRDELHQALSNNKYLVVIDDLWGPEIMMRLKTALPDNENSSRVLLTTRILKVAYSITYGKSIIEMEPLSNLDSWALLRNKTFGDDEACPPELESYGKRIASNCNGLPLSLLVIGGLLSQGRKDVEYWRSIERDTKSDTYDAESYTGILSLSYDLLPCKLKPCFLYMAAFPRDSDIPVSKLIMLWVAEGFLPVPPPKPWPAAPRLMEEVAEQSLLDLIDRNLVVIRKNRSNGRVKAVGIHNSLRDLAEKESENDMFFHSRKRYPQVLKAGTNSQRRVSVHRNILMCLEDVYNSTKRIEKARSLLYVGPHHQHPMPYNLTFDLLRVLDAFTFFFIQFPDEILKLVHLRYLSFTYNGQLPSKIAKLHKLQVLIVKRQPKILFVGVPFLPDEIWGMKELRHLLMTETDLPINLPPTDDGTTILFENLQTLSNINADSSTTEKVLKHACNLRRLEMWMEELKKAEFNMDRLDQLEIFKFTVLNPDLKPHPEIQPRFYFPKTLIKLCLSGTGLPWEDMEAIAALPNLQVLKLKELAFHGAEWCPVYNFPKLKFLLIEYLNLQKWEADSYHFPRLEQLILRYCYDLEELPSDFVGADSLRLIELVDCCPEAVEWAEDIIVEVEEFGFKNPQVRIYSSCEYIDRGLPYSVELASALEWS